MALTYKSIDNMKITRDLNTVTNAQKVTHLNALASVFPSATHFTIDCYLHNYGYHTQAYVQEWVDAVRTTGKKVWWRGIPNYSASVTAAQAIINVCADITANPTWYANGDIFEFGAESNPYIFSNAPDNWSNSTVLWSQWMADMITSLNTAFSGIGKSGVITDIQSITHSYWLQGDVKATALTAFNNQISIDYYPLDILNPASAVDSMCSTLTSLHATYPTASIIISEIGCSNSFNTTETQQRDILRTALIALSKLSYIKGLNYWVGWNSAGGGGATQLFQTNSLTLPRAAAKSVNEFFQKGNCTGRMDVI